MAACLAPLAEVADEIIIAADDRVGEDDLAEYAAVATELLRFQFTTSNRHWSWLAGRARGDWVLVIDGDEAPSTALLEQIPQVVERREIRQCSVPVRWLFGDATTYVTSEPIASDRRFRLQRNDAWLEFGGRQHSIEIEHGPGAHIDAPLYHLGLLLMSREQREAKVAAYESERPGLMSEVGVPVNSGLYLPEDHDLTLSSVGPPDADRLVAAFGAARSSVAPIDAKALAHGTPAEIERACGVGESRPMTLSPRSGPPGELVEGRPSARWWIDVTNGSQVTWPAFSEHKPEVRVGVRWLDDHRDVVGEGRADLPHALAPGETTLVPLVLVPPRAGSLTLQLDGVEEHVRWFDRPHEFKVDVAPV